MQRSRNAPTAIYLAGHTEVPDDQGSQELLAYVPANYLEASNGQFNYIYYEEMRQLLFEGPTYNRDRSWSVNYFQLSTRPWLELTFGLEPPSVHHRGLPYVLECNGNEPQWRETKYHDGYVENSDDIVHFAATSPGERSALFRSGAIFTRTLCDINPSEALSLSEIIKRLSEKITEHGQRPRVRTLISVNY
ncbi:hypothetical protein RHS01_07288 [Rhizoctonia solani]|uniref:Uncharacterized protein n=1 Tax=Rhizoctonia solani TaxID=456999 RepID=A0A8H7IB62_9AGAM|nr:hypothetical protein RHS01_07288 [Rhizoctonia solani]